MECCVSVPSINGVRQLWLPGHSFQSQRVVSTIIGWVCPFIGCRQNHNHVYWMAFGICMHQPLTDRSLPWWESCKDFQVTACPNPREVILLVNWSIFSVAGWKRISGLVNQFNHINSSLKQISFCLQTCAGAKVLVHDWRSNEYLKLTKIWIV